MNPGLCRVARTAFVDSGIPVILAATEERRDYQDAPRLKAPPLQRRRDPSEEFTPEVQSRFS